jgi:hypothetical protein
MGLDYGYITAIPEQNYNKVFDFISSHGELTVGFENTKCAILHFDLDSFIFKFLEGGYNFKPHYNKDEIEKQLVAHNKAGIGCFYIYERDLVKESKYKIIRFVAATDDMSLLLKESVSIEKWFIKFSEVLESSLTYLDMEAEGSKIIYWAGKSINIE